MTTVVIPYVISIVFLILLILIFQNLSQKYNSNLFKFLIYLFSFICVVLVIPIIGLIIFNLN